MPGQYVHWDTQSSAQHLPLHNLSTVPQTLTATPHATAARTTSLARPTNWGAQFSYLPSVMSGPSSAQIEVAKVSWNTVQIRELPRYLVSTSEPLLVDSLISREISAELRGRSTKLRPEIRAEMERDMPRWWMRAAYVPGASAGN